jgi:hypothetical protein
MSIAKSQNITHHTIDIHIHIHKEDNSSMKQDLDTAREKTENEKGIARERNLITARERV